jgi:hypothetical protein
MRGRALPVAASADAAVTRPSAAKPRTPAARTVAPGHGQKVEQQPDDVTCGPACLQGVYRY